MGAIHARNGGKFAGLALLLSACSFDPRVSNETQVAGSGDGGLGVAASDASFASDAMGSMGPDAAPPPCLLDSAYQERPGSDHRYRFEGSGLFYDEAQASCANTGGHLVVIDDDTENDFVITLGGAPWIGVNDLAAESDFAWVTGVPLSFTDWSGSEPNDNGGDEDCAILQGGNWNDGECSNQREFVCECDPALRIPLAPACMSSAAYSRIYQGRRYRSETAETDYASAKASCESEGGHLMVVTDDAENDYLRDMISNSAWIGYADTEIEGEFEWTTGSTSSYTKWSGPQPDDSGGEDCVEVGTDGNWNDQNCLSSRDYVCECDPTVAIPSLSGI